MSIKQLLTGIILSLTTLFLLSSLNTTYAASTIYINSTTGNDSTGDGSESSPYKTFYKGYSEATANDTLDLSGTFTWTNADETGDASTSGYTIAKDITIQGQGADTTVVQSALTENSADRRVFTIPIANTVTIKSLTIRYGRVTSPDGGGVYNDGTLTLDAVDLSYNRATGGSGGGLTTRGQATVQNSTVHHNVAHYKGGGLERSYYSGSGGAPSASDTLDIINSTIAFNTVTQTVAYLEGGGVFYRRGEGSITNSVITQNQVINGGNSRSTHGLGTGYESGIIKLKNSIIAGNILGTSGGDIGHRQNGSGAYQDNGGNIIGRPGYYSDGFSASATTWLDSTAYNIAIDGTYELQDGGSTTGTLDMETSLAQNDSLTKTTTFAITESDSITVNNGQTGTNGSIPVPTLDQRGATRNGTLDIGAYEYDGGGIISYTLTYNSGSNGSVAGTSPQTVQDGADGAEVTAVPNSGYVFTGWSDASTDNPRTDAAVSSDITVTANFEAESPPVISALTSSNGADTATITWTTDEQSSSKVLYGPSDSTGSSTSETDTSPRVTSHSVVLSNLTACTKYYYKVISKDSYNTSATSSVKSFTTSGCEISEIVETVEDDLPVSGGTVSYTKDGTSASITAPNNYYSEQLTIQIHKLDDSAVNSKPAGKTMTGGKVFNLVAIDSSKNEVTAFDDNVTFVIEYSDSDVFDIVESTLDVYKYVSGDWVDQGCVLDSDANTLTCTLSSFSVYGLFGEENIEPTSTPTPMPTSTPTIAPASPTPIPTVVQTTTQTNHTSTVQESIKSDQCDYIVQQGDSLWAVAVMFYGDGMQFELIRELNKEKYPQIESYLEIGWQLNVCETSVEVEDTTVDEESESDDANDTTGDSTAQSETATFSSDNEKDNGSENEESSSSNPITDFWYIWVIILGFGAVAIRAMRKS